MTSDQVVREQLLANLNGRNAHMTFEEAVTEFPAKHFNTKPVNSTYTPWHLLEHIRIGLWDILEFIRDPDHVSPPWPAGYWPDPSETANQEAWDQTISSFLSDIQALRNIISDPRTDLYVPIPHAPDYTIFREILVASDHIAYHIGEFSTFRQVLANWSET